MDKRAFKQRMQNLKSYRENNPGKGYWDWKVETFADGGEVGDPEKERFYQATGRSSSGRPLEEGLKPVFSLEDAANMTPIGDAISAKDAYDAVKNRDWLSAGLAALTVLPFVPSGLRNVKAAARYIPTVNRTEQSLINQALGNISKKRDYLSDIANSRNRVLEDINTIPYRNRAEQADKIFGTNYSETYDLLDDLYQHRYFDLPEVQPKDDVQNLDEPVSSTLLKKYLDKMSDSDPIKKMFKQHKNINAYTKWFNTIPLLGTTALGANAYFNNNKDE